MTKIETKLDGAKELASSGFYPIPQEWVKTVAEKTGDEFNGVMWGIMFRATNAIDIRKIKSLLRPVDDEELGPVQEVGDTGFYAWEIDGELLLGINGAGYDFYEAHWLPLYEALGLRWHSKE